MMPKEDEEEIANMSIEGVYWHNDTPTLYDSKIIIDERTSLLNIFVSRFILVHEIGHIFNGHCSFLACKEKGSEYIPMYYSDDTSEKKVCPLDIRTMEMDADFFAVTQSMRYLVFLYQTSDTNVFCQRLKPMDLFYWWAFAIRSHFLLCEDRYMDSKEYNNEMRHLPSNARWGMLLATAMEAIDIFALPQAIQKSEIDEFKDQLGKGMFEAEKVFNNLKYTNYSYLDQFKDNKVFEEYSHEVHENWGKLVKELKAHSRCPLYES